jgi:hypothetical protein
VTAEIRRVIFRWRGDTLDEVDRTTETVPAAGFHGLVGGVDCGDLTAPAW